MMIPKHKPPYWATWLLRRLGDDRLMEELEGDLLELFAIWEKEHGLLRARVKYITTVLTLIRPFENRMNKNNEPHTSTGFNMVSSYLKMGWRSLLKNKVSSIINISGLTLGLATSILVLLIVSEEFKYDSFHAHLTDNYLLMKNQVTNDGISTGRSTAGPMAESLRRDFAEVKYSGRVAGWNGQQVMANGVASHGHGLYVDTDIFRMMTFTPISGDPVSTLETKNSVVITNSMAKKLFGNTDPIGKTVVVNKIHSLTIGSVIKDIPSASTIQFEMALPFSIYENENGWLRKWDDNRIQTWLQLQPNTDVELFNKKITELLQVRSNDKTVSLFAYPMKDLHLYGGFSNGHQQGGKITVVLVLIFLGAFMLAVACINFMNITTAQSEHRAREVGVRKVLGASRRKIIAQFLNESFLISFVSLTVAVTIIIIVLPSFSELIHSNIRFDATNVSLWIFIGCIGMFTSILSGIYPALFLSRFIPVQVLKGRIARSKSSFRNILVSFQFVISSFFLISTIIMFVQFRYIQDRPIGYEQDNLISVPLDATLASKFEYLKNEVLKINEVVSATGSSGNILYANGAITGMDWPGKRPGEELSVLVSEVELDWSKTIGIAIVAGRDFDPSFTSDTSACLINETAVTKMGLDEPVGSVVGGNQVIGVFKDFVYNNPSEEIAPMAVYLRPGRMNYLYIRVRNNEKWREALTSIERTFKALSPEHTFSFSFTKDEYQNRFDELTDVGVLVTSFGGMTIFIACLGLFGLSGFVAERRSKEMTIRKVFGATVARILITLSSDFLKPVIIALLIATPVTVFAADMALSSIAYRAPLHWWIFAFGGVVILTLAGTVVLYHGWRTARENPVLRLRNE